ncbi:MAG: XylR N-terminal domain-containing protein, partial [bacterium]
MRAEDLRLEDLISFSEGLVSLHGRRLILHDIHATAQLRKDLIDTLGVDQARRILTRFGYFWGKADAAAMQHIIGTEPIEEWLKTGPHLHRLEGVAKVEIKSLELGNGGRFRMEVVWHDSVEAEEQLIEFGVSPDADCWITLGYASGYTSFCLGKPVYFK